METLEITTSPQLDGINFGFSPLVLRQLQETFPGTKPLWKIFIAVDKSKRDENLQLIFDRMIKYFLPAMVGVEDNSELKKIKYVKFWDPYKRIPDTTIELN